MLDSLEVVGRTLGNYRLVEVLGQGGMGVVYRGEHALLGRKAAIKVLRSELSRRADIIARFFNEARATSQVSHPSIVSCIDFGHDPKGSAYIVMELLEGESLRDRLDQGGRLPWPRAVTIARQVASALGAAHQLGVVHRDLKPDNVFLVEDADVVGGERAKVLDFGIAKLAGDVGVESVFRTRTGSLIGTPVYMSPEQCRGAGAVDERTDIYSLGCVLYQMVCGSPPFVAEGHGDLITMHITVPPTPPRRLEPTVPDWLDHVIVRMLAKNPAERHADMGEVIADLDRLAGLPTPSPIPTGRVAVGTPAPPTTLGLSAAERMVTTPIASRPARRRLVPALVACALATGALAYAVTAGVDRGGIDDAPEPSVQPIEETPAAVAEPPPPAAAPPAAAPVAAEVADAGSARAEPRPAEAEPPAGAPARRLARSKRRKPVREPAARPKPDRPPSTRVRGGIAEPDL